MDFNSFVKDFLVFSIWFILLRKGFFMEVHSQGKVVEDIAECLRRVPRDPRTISAIKSVHASGHFLHHLFQSFYNLIFVKNIGLVMHLLQV